MRLSLKASLSHLFDSYFHSSFVCCEKHLSEVALAEQLFHLVLPENQTHISNITKFWLKIQFRSTVVDDLSVWLGDLLAIGLLFKDPLWLTRIIKLASFEPIANIEGADPTKVKDSGPAWPSEAANEYSADVDWFSVFADCSPLSLSD